MRPSTDLALQQKTLKNYSNLSYAEPHFALASAMPINGASLLQGLMAMAQDVILSLKASHRRPTRPLLFKELASRKGTLASLTGQNRFPGLGLGEANKPDRSNKPLLRPRFMVRYFSKAPYASWKSTVAL